MATAQVRIWRPAGEPHVLLMAGRTRSYAIEPRGEYVFGIVEGQPMRSRRGRERRVVRPGELVAWDPVGGARGHHGLERPVVVAPDDRRDGAPRAPRGRR